MAATSTVFHSAGGRLNLEQAFTWGLNSVSVLGHDSLAHNRLTSPGYIAIFGRVGKRTQKATSFQYMYDAPRTTTRSLL
jgi:hypothetical protein